MIERDRNLKVVNRSKMEDVEENPVLKILFLALVCFAACERALLC